jgi:endonuclease/exonuclease/phosphatase family metal-dependent hydrolase
MDFDYVDEKVNFYSLAEKEKMIKKQLAVLNKIFKDFPADKKKLIDKIINSVAFMSVELMNLEEVIKRNGQVDKYRNGAYQTGYKKSANSEAYNTMKKTYLADVKLLTDCLRENLGDGGSDEFDEFLKRRKKE